MICEPCTFSPEQEADCSPTSFSGTSQLSLWSGMPTPVESCENEPQKDGSQACMCGKGMSGCSIHPNTPEAWIASMQDSLAKTLALLESRQEYVREPDQVFTEKFCGLQALLSQDSSFWKTCQQSFLMDSEQYSQTWPRWGMTQGGFAYAHPMSERRITETGGGYLPTPLVSTGSKWGTRKDYHSNLSELASLDEFNHLDGEYVSLQWLAWLMGFPTEWTNLNATVMPKSLCKPQSLGDY
jgi:hypothetical protein